MKEYLCVIALHETSVLLVIWLTITMIFLYMDSRLKSQHSLFTSHIPVWNVCCPETSARNCHCMLCNIPEERRSHLFWGRSMKSTLSTISFRKEPTLCKWMYFCKFQVLMFTFLCYVFCFIQIWRPDPIIPLSRLFFQVWANLQNWHVQSLGVDLCWCASSRPTCPIWRTPPSNLTSHMSVP
jgi:hypothetical protein